MIINFVSPGLSFNFLKTQENTRRNERNKMCVFWNTYQAYIGTFSKISRALFHSVLLYQMKSYLHCELCFLQFSKNKINHALYKK